MHLLDTILKKALSSQYTDIHLLIRSQDCCLFYRKNRQTLEKISLKRKEGDHLRDYLLYQSQARFTVCSQFYHLSYSHPLAELRIAYYQGKVAHLTIRVHHAGKKTKALNKKNFLNPLLPFLKNRFFLQLIGPINSGKTTLYYQLLTYFYEQCKTLLSVEEPIEKQQEFWQICFDKHEQWLEIVEHIIRFDLDIIGFGEIRKEQYWTVLKRIYDSGHNIIATAHRQCSKIEQLLANTTINHFVLHCHNYQYDLYRGEHYAHRTTEPLVSLSSLL